MRLTLNPRTVTSAVFALVLLSGAAAAEEKPNSAIHEAPLYESVEDPPGQWRTRILAAHGFQFGGAGAEPESLLRSDLGGPTYFLRVEGGVRVRGQPIIFPDGSRKHFDFEDFSCTVTGSGPTNDVVCRSKSNGQLYHSRLVGGGVVSFDIRCFGQLERVCHYELIGGRGMRPRNIQES